MVVKHWMNKGRNREEVFQSDIERDHYMGLIRKYSARFEVHVHSWTLLGNHTHFIVAAEDVEKISALFRHCNSSFARFRNLLTDRSGAVWSERPRVVEIKDVDQWIACQLYIDLNALRARLANTIDEHKWSSYHFYAWGTGQPPTSPSPWYDGLGSTLSQCQSHYRSLVEAERLKWWDR